MHMKASGVPQLRPPPAAGGSPMPRPGPESQGMPGSFPKAPPKKKSQAQNSFKVDIWGWYRTYRILEAVYKDSKAPPKKARLKTLFKGTTLGLCGGFQEMRLLLVGAIISTAPLLGVYIRAPDSF